MSSGNTPSSKSSREAPFGAFGAYRECGSSDLFIATEEYLIIEYTWALHGWTSFFAIVGIFEAEFLAYYFYLILAGDILGVPTLQGIGFVYLFFFGLFVVVDK